MSKAIDFWKALPNVQHLKNNKVEINITCSDIVCFINPFCPDSQNLSKKLTKFCIHHNQMPGFDLQLHLVDVDGLLDKESTKGQLLLYSSNGYQKDTNNDLKEKIFPMWKIYGNKTVDSAFSENGKAYFIPQLVLWHNDTKAIKGAWYQHHEHALRLHCNLVDCKYCLKNICN